MKKYKIYRSFGDLDKQVRQHELVAVESGERIDDVTDALVEAVKNDLAELPEYAGCECVAYAPESVPSFRRVRRYQYEMQGVVSPPVGDNILIDYGIMEESAEA